MTVLKNYTSSVPVDRTILRIEAALVKAGATDIVKTYNGNSTAGRILEGICFTIVEPVTGKPVSVRLPANAQAVLDTMKQAIRRPRAGTLERLEDQAARTAWKIVQDWVEVQMTLIQMRQAEFLQVFLPYVWDGRRTFYGALKENHFKALMAPCSKEVKS